MSDGNPSQRTRDGRRRLHRAAGCPRAARRRTRRDCGRPASHFADERVPQSSATCATRRPSAGARPPGQATDVVIHLAADHLRAALDGGPGRHLQAERRRHLQPARAVQAPRSPDVPARLDQRRHRRCRHRDDHGEDPAPPADPVRRDQGRRRNAALRLRRQLRDAGARRCGSPTSTARAWKPRTASCPGSCEPPGTARACRSTETAPSCATWCMSTTSSSGIFTAWKAGHNGPLILGSGESVTVNDILDAARAVTGAEIPARARSRQARRDAGRRHRHLSRQGAGLRAQDGPQGRHRHGVARVLGDMPSDIQPEQARATLPAARAADDEAVDVAAIEAFTSQYGSRATALPPLAIVIAAFNEQGSIGPVSRRCRGHLRPRGRQDRRLRRLGRRHGQGSRCRWRAGLRCRRQQGPGRRAQARLPARPRGRRRVHRHH